MKKDLIKLEAKTDQEKQILSNIITPKTREQYKAIQEYVLKLWLENNKEYPEGYDDNFENHEGDNSDFAQFQQLAVLLHKHITVETTYSDSYGNFLFKVNKSAEFDKVPNTRPLKKSDSLDEKINEYFEIEFIVKEVHSTYKEIVKQVEEFKTWNEPDFIASWIKPKLIIQDISFNVHKDSNLSYLDLLTSTVNEGNRLSWLIRKDFGDIAGESERRLFPFDLEKANKLANFRLDNILFYGDLKNEDEFIKELKTPQHLKNLSDTTKRFILKGKV